MPPKPTGRAPRGTGRGRGRPRASQGRTATDAESQPEPAATTAEVTAPAPLTAAPVTAVAARAESSESGAVEVTPKLPSTSASAKFRPKGIRRAEAERDKIAQEQLRLQNERIAEDARAQARANRLRGRGASRGRGRGGIPGRPFGGPAAVGPFGNPYAASVGSRSGHGAPGGASASGTHSGAGFRVCVGNKLEDGTFRGQGGAGVTYMEVDDHRINADLLYGQEEVTADAGSPSESASGIRLLRPMATRRIEHEAKKIVMMSSKEIEARDRGQEQEVEDEEDEEDSAMFLPVVGHEDGMDIDVEKDEKVWDHSLPKTRGMVKIKREDGNIMDTMDIDEIAAGRVMENSEMGSPVKEAPESPDQKQKGVTTEVAGSTPRRKSLKRKPIAPDQEEVRLTEDLSYMLNLLGVQSEAVDEKTADASGDKADVEEEASTAKPRLHSNALDGHMLLFQFPPILPPLKSSNFTGAERPVKDEPDDDVVVLDKAGPKPRANIDLTKDSEGKIKAEDDDDDDDMKGEKGEDLPEGFKIPKEGGFVGNLVMRRSGKVQLIWGGTTFDLAPGTHSHFLSTAALLEEDDPDPSVDLKAAHVGTVYGMGRVEGKFVLAPRFAEEGDWTVDPRDLEIPVDEQD